MHIQPLTEPETYRVQDVAAKVNELAEVVNSLAVAMSYLVDVMQAAKAWAGTLEELRGEMAIANAKRVTG